MGVEKKDEELFMECKESVKDVFGWKIVIFLPQNTFWKILVMITVFLSFVIITTKMFYLKTNKISYILEVLCDSIYFVDVLCAILHFGLGKTSKLRQGERRPFIFILIDIISLIPLNLLFEYLIYEVGEKSGKFYFILRANVILRIYQVPVGFSHIKKTVSKIKIYYFLIFIEVFAYFCLITHFFSCFIQKYFDKKHKKKCLSHFAFCVFENDLLTFALLDHNYIEPLSRYPLKDYRLLLIAEFLFGFIFTYGFITPTIICVNLAYLKEFFEYSYKRKQLRLLIKNMIEEKALNKKLTNYFHYAWTYGKGDNFPDIISLFPLSLQKTVFCDIHWEALRHSDFLQSLSNGCKRSLSLHMTTEFVLPKTVLFQKQTEKTYFMYLESGLVQVMAEENNESPVLNLSDGTVLGEISFFYQLGSKALVRTGKFSVIHVLKCTDLFRVLLHYPKDMRQIYHKMKLRLKVARAVRKNKIEICPLFLHDPNYSQTAQANVKWLKHQFRALKNLEKGGEIKKADLLPEQSNESSAKHERGIQALETHLEHTSLYLSLLSINDEGEKGNDIVCLKVSLPWFLDPSSHFLTWWKIINNAAALTVIVLYPAFLGWFPFVPAWFFNVAIVINFIYILDVLIQFNTAVKIKGVVITKFSAMVAQRFTSLGFYLDLLAALPLYLLVYFYSSLQASFKLNLLLSNTLLKSYILLPTMNKLCYSPRTGIYYRATIKYILIMYFSIYWAAAILNLMGMECILYECGEKDWFPQNSVQRRENYKTINSLFLAVYMVLDVPIKGIQTDESLSFVVYFVMYIISNFLCYAWQGECVACYVLEHSNELEYRHLIEHVHDFMLQHEVTRMIKKRVMGTLEFQWLYDKGNYITQKRRILEDLSTDLRDEVDRKFLLPILQKSRLFMWEDDEFFVDLCRRAKRFAVPAKSLLSTFGTQTMSLYIIHKGYVQINSFTVGDSHLDISTPLVFKSGDTFPVVVAFSQIPSSITALTLTDCELLILDLEDILTTVITYNVLPDIVQALKEIDLTPISSARIGISKIKSHLEFDKKAYNAPFIRLKSLGTLLKYCFIPQGINSESKKYLCWEATRNVLILFNLIVWPFVFGCCCKWDHRMALIYTLLAVDCVSSLVDFYFRLHIGYYNDLGIYVMHPLATFLRYLTSSFVLDLIAFVPNFHMMYLLKKNQLNFGVAIITVHMTMRSISVYRILGLFNYSTYNLKKFLNLTKLIKCLFFGLFALHYYINFVTYLYLQGKMKPELSFNIDHKLEPKKPYEYYFYELALIVSILLRGQVFFDVYSIYNLVKIAVLGTLAVLYQTFLFSVLTLTFTSSSANCTLYQYYYKNFVKYLREERVEDNISNQAIKYFEFQWRKSNGIDMEKIFSSFPRTLHEDILFPLYKDTLSGVRCLSAANEAFYRALSRNVQVVTLMSASVIIFNKQVQGDIFFVHKGKCFIEEVSKILIKGAIIGDIRHGEPMKHTIKALTRVDLLRIPSHLFFVIMGNFYSIKRAFQLEMEGADDFIESIYVDRREDSSPIEIESITKEEHLLEVEYETTNSILENMGTRPFKVKRRKTFLNPDSLTVRVLDFICFIDAYITFIVVPTFIGATLLTWWALAIIYCLDAVWIVKIILTIRTTLPDSKRGNYIYKSKVIILNYLHKFDGMVLHILSVLPIELIAIACYGKSSFYQHCFTIYYCYSNRLLRIPHILYYIKFEIKELLINIYLKLLNVSVFALGIINLFVSLNLLLRRDKHYSKMTCHWGAQKSQLDDIIKSYFFVLNNLVAGGVPDEMPETPLEIFFQVVIAVMSLLLKAVVVGHVLESVYVSQFTKLDQLLRFQQLEKYLSIRDVSPPLFQEMYKYSCNLLSAYKEEAHPTFLKKVPPFLRTKIMEDVYLHHFSECYIFQGIEQVFLKQLAMRLERFIFFPGDYIVEMGDVDQNMYFIHKGEVKCVETDDRYPVLERTVDLLTTGECFGIIQGISFSYPHMNTYRAKVLTDILVLNYYKWGDLRMAFPEITGKIYKRFKQMGYAKG